MRNFKKVVALVLAVALAMSTWTVAFAAEPTSADKLVTLGLLSDASATSLSAGLTREIGLTMILKDLGYTQADADKAAAAPFTDTKGWVVKWANLAYEKGITKGVTATTFGGSAKLSGDVFLTFALRGLGVTVAKTSDALAAAITAGLLPAGSTLPATFTKGDAAGIMLASLSFVDPTTKVSLLDKLIAAKVVTEANAIAAGLKTAYVALEVKSVSATNNKEVVIEFSKEVDKDTAQTAGNYTFTGGLTATSATKDGAKVTVTLTGIGAAQQQSVDVTVKNVKDLDGKVIADTTKSVKFFDATVPTVSKVEVTGPKKLKVTFSEPITSSAIATTANFVIDNNTYSIASVAASGTTAVEITLGTSLPAGKHSITVNNVGANADPAIKDYAAFYVAKATVEFEYVVDNVVPTATIDTAKQNTVKIVFSKDIDSTLRGNLRVYHTYSGNASYDADSYTWADDKTVTATFSTYLPVGTATVYVNNVDADNLLKDYWGNKFANATLTATITADSTAPTVTKIEAKTSTTLEVTFSEAVTGATTVSNYTLKDSSNALVNITSAVLKADNTYTLTTATLNGGSYTLTVKNVKDTSVSENKMVDYTQTIAVDDKIAPTVTPTGAYSTDTKKIIVTFSEAMKTSGENSILDENNYQINLAGSWVDLSSVDGATVAAGSGNKSVIITFSAAQATLNDNDQVRVARVADVAGNKTAGFTTDVTLAADNVVLANIDTDTEKATSTTTVSFDVKTTLSGIDVSKFKLDGSGANKAATSATYVNGDNKATVTVTVADGNKFASDLTAGLVDVTILAGGLTTGLGTTNSATITIPVANISDYVAPSVVSTVTGDTTGNGHIDKVVVTYSEALYVASVADADYTVEGYEVTGVTVAGAVVTINVKELASFDTAATPKVTLVGAVSDNSAQRNSFGAQAAITSTDGAKPVLVSAVITAGATAGFGNNVGDSIKLTFSESVNTNFGVAAAPTVAELEAIFVASAGAIAGGTLSATDLSTTASNELVITTVTALTTPLLVAGTIATDAAPTANDIEDAANLTIFASQPAVTIQ